MKLKTPRNNQILKVVFTLTLLLTTASAHAGWWGHVKNTGILSWEKSKELSLTSVRAGRLAAHKSWESAQIGARHGRLAAEKSWEQTQTGWHRFKVIVKP